MERAFQRADCRRDRRVHVGERRGCHARGERGCIELMVGMEDERHVERFGLQLARAFPGEHVEEVRGVVQRRVGIDDAAAAGDAPGSRHNRPHLGCHRHARPVPPLGRHVVRARIEVRQRRDERAKGIHGIRGRQRAHQTQHAFRQAARRGELRLHLSQFRSARQSSMPQQAADFLERRMLGEIVNVVPSIREHAPLAVEIADRGRRDDDVFEAGFYRGVAGHFCVASGPSPLLQRASRRLSMIAGPSAAPLDLRRSPVDYWLSDTCVFSTTLSPENCWTMESRPVYRKPIWNSTRNGSVP